MLTDHDQIKCGNAIQLRIRFLGNQGVIIAFGQLIDYVLTILIGVVIGFPRIAYLDQYAGYFTLAESLNVTGNFEGIGSFIAQAKLIVLHQ